MDKRLLVVAGASASGPDKLPPGVLELIRGAEEISVVTPMLPTRFEWLASATDKRREQADARLRTVLGHLEAVGNVARSQVGADDPLLAIEDAIRDFDPDHLLIALRPTDQADWQERGLLDEVKRRFELPTTSFVIE
jgi:hypothetical protein